MNQRFILTILSRRHGKNHAERCRQICTKAGETDVRVEIWQVIATSYKGTVREAK